MEGLEYEVRGLLPRRNREERGGGELGGLVWDLIHGPGGMNDYECHELVVWHDDDRLAAAHWVIKCLANPQNEDAGKILQAILERRGRLAGELEVA